MSMPLDAAVVDGQRTGRAGAALAKREEVALDGGRWRIDRKSQHERLNA